MKTTHTFLTLATFLISPITMASDATIEQGKQLYKTHCSACHGATGGMDMNKRLAPPIAGVKLHYIASHADKQPFVQAITEWLDKPDAGKSLMPGAIRKFKLMPPITVAKEDAIKIATYIYQGELDKPAGFDAHVEKMHGKK